MAFLQDRAASDPDPGARIAVAEAIAQGWGGDDSALAFLEDRAASDPEPAARTAVSGAIAQGWGRNDRALAFLQDRAASDPEPATRAAILRFLVYPSIYWFGPTARDEQAPLAGVRGGLGDPDAVVRQTAVELTLALFEHRPNFYAQEWGGSDVMVGIVELVLDLASSDPDVDVRLTAFSTISAIQTAFYSPLGADSPLFERANGILKDGFSFLLEQASRDKSEETRSRAIWLIADASPDRPALAFLQKLAADHAVARTRLEALRAIAWRWGNEGEVVAYLKERTGSDRANRTEVFELLERLEMGFTVYASSYGSVPLYDYESMRFRHRYGLESPSRSGGQ